MLDLTEKQVVEYFKRCYTAVDGLWFMKVEEIYGFDTALDIDNEVWKVMPKIQARKLKSMTGLSGGMESLAKCLTTKLAYDGFAFDSDYSDDGNLLMITLRHCPWHEIMINSGREALSGRVGTRICTTEYMVWAAEFSDQIEFELQEQICEGADCCRLLFRAIG
ncbi:MAG: L-2-amino-thiazoline-4-carboxylic acid hydrolase [Deltaproteobacteria bacterium]|nr:L-2-amino-thiazoline-4-carboxylic acid hydrolase [Deltaproteobacteria bacterium]MBW2071418.1 L-2-amino-thiazoline-4-carboxylic acid hydrolase [Deltaproteobacteria bacterium]